MSSCDISYVACHIKSRARDARPIRNGLLAMQEEVVRSDSLRRKALEPVGRVIPAVYNAILSTLSSLSARDPKHGPRLVFENLAALDQPIEALAAVAPDIDPCARDLAGNMARARDKVVEEQLESSKLWPLLSFAGKLHLLLKDVSPQEVQFQVCTACLVARPGLFSLHCTSVLPSARRKDVNVACHPRGNTVQTT
jgi:hypothetical protein